MSGHSHFKTIKRIKEAEDKKRGKIFSKLSRLISVAVKEKGDNPSTNPKLKLAIDQAKSANMPKDNIERAIKKGTGELASDKLEQATFEAYGPGGVAIIIEAITDNKNRTLGEIKNILSQHNGKLAGEGSVKWMFGRKGSILVQGNKEELELTAIEAGAEDIKWQDEYLNIHTKPENMESVKKKLEEKGINIESSSLDWVAKEEIEVKEKESCEKLFNALDENDDIQEIYSNLKL